MTTQPSRTPQEIIDWLDMDNPKSLYNMVPESIQNGMRSLDPSFLTKEPKELEAEYPEEEVKIKSIGSTIKKLRHAFWEEYHRAHGNNSNIIIDRVIKGVCNRSYFRDKVVPVPHRLAYILIAPDDYRYNLLELHDIGLAQMKEIMLAPNWTKDKFGNEIFDSKLARVKVEVWDKTQNRLYGGAVHRSLQVNENFNRELSNSNSSHQGQDQIPDFSQMDPEKLEQMVQRLAEGRKPFEMPSDQREREVIDVEVGGDD